MRTVPLDITDPPAAPLRAPRSAADRCPTAIALHPAADGLIARVRLPGGRLTAAQARVLAGWAGDAGAGEVAEPGRAGDDAGAGAGGAGADRIELTGRGNLQIRGLRGDQAGPLAAALHGAGLLPSEPHDQARTIVASPLAGRLPGAVRVDAVVKAIDAALCAAPELVALSGRFLTAVDDGSGVVDAAGADVALVPAAPPAASAGGGAGLTAGGVEQAAAGVSFVMLVGGRAAGIVDEGDAAAAVIAAAQGFVREAAGAAWRVSELADGGAALRASLLEGGVVRDLAGVRPSFRRAELPPLGVGQQADGRGYVRASSVLGRLTPAQLLAAADAAELGHTDLRIATDRSLTLLDLAPKHAAAALSALAAAGLAVDPADPSLGLTACAGLGCSTSRGDVRGAATLRSRTRRPGAAREHLVGCERRCGAPVSGTTLVLAEHESPQAFAARALAQAEETTR